MNLPVPIDEQEYIEQTLPEPTIQSNIYRNNCERAALLLANGNSIAGTATLLGLSRNTVAWWINHTEHFRALIEGEKSRIRQELLDRIAQAGQKPHLWAANAWILERNKTFGDEFKLNQDKGSAGPVVVQIAINHPAIPQINAGNSAGNKTEDV